MDRETLRKIGAAAAGNEEPDLVLKNCRIADVFTKEIIAGDIAVSCGYIAGIGSYEASCEHDMNSRYVLPGFIDAHVHIESSLASPAQFASAVIPRGTVSVIADPHEICNVAGTDGLLYMIRAASQTPLRIHFMLPSCVPATEFETSGAVMGLKELSSLIAHPNILGLGEMMAFPQAVAGDPEVLDKLLLAYHAHKHVDGHAPGLSGNALSSYAALGIRTDHECSTPEELKQRISRGMYVMLREGSASKDLRNLLEGITDPISRWCMFCTDDRQLDDIFTEGHIDNHLKIARSCGIDPLTAVQMASVNAAVCCQLRHQGAAAPGYYADLTVVDDLDSFTVRKVYIGGRLRASDGALTEEIPSSPSTGVSDTMHVDVINEEQLALHISATNAHVIQMTPRSLLTKLVRRRFPRDSRGRFVFQPGSGVCKIIVLERHTRSGQMGIGLLENYGITGGAAALSISHDSHNIIAAGDSDRDIVTAVNALISQGGGIVLASQSEVIESLPLPIGGLMSDLGASEIRSRVKRIEDTARNRLKIHPDIDPVMSLSFLALPVIPEVRITDKGLFDVSRFTHIPV